MQYLQSTINQQINRRYSKQIYISPTKRNRLQHLPNIIEDGKFVKKNQQSVDTSIQEENKFKKQIFTEKNDIVELQIWVIKKQKKINVNNDHLDALVNMKLENKKIIQQQQVMSKDLLPRVSSLITQKSTPNENSKILQNYSNKVIDLGYSEQKYIKEKLVGTAAVQKFYFRYKNIEKVKQMQKMKNQINPLTIILTILESYNIPPKRMDIIKLKGNQAVLDLKQIGLGQSISIKAISDILDKIKYFQTVNLSYNAIMFDTVDIIVPKLRGLTKIDLSHNRIGRQGVDMIAVQILSKFPQDLDGYDSSDSENDRLLEELNLQENILSDTSLNNFLLKAKVFQNLRILNLSKNFLGNVFALKLKEFLIDQKYLDELYLHWNDITSKGMRFIFDGLVMNKNLKVLDLSWNQIGYQAIPAIKSFFTKNKSLLHLDISNCNISYEDTKQLAESIKVNHTIFGLHYDGNEGNIDSMGFLHSFRDKQSQLKFSLRNSIMERIKGVDKRPLYNEKYDFRENKPLKTCWICHGWMQKVILIPMNIQSEQACFIHFDFQNQKGIKMLQIDGNYSLRKMFPYKNIRFFITKISKTKQFTHLAFNPIKYQDQFQIENLQKSFKINQFFIDTKQFRNIELSELNILPPSGYYSEELFDEQYTYQFKCYPRINNLSIDGSLFDNPPSLSVNPSKNKKKNKKERQKKIK